MKISLSGHSLQDPNSTSFLAVEGGLVTFTLDKTLDVLFCMQSISLKLVNSSVKICGMEFRAS
jgi:hypothetical protein